MEEKNIRWGEVVAGLLIVGSAIGCVVSLQETIREADGLAMSSRNVRLTAAGREKAPVLYAAITRAAADIRIGHADRMAIREAAETMREADCSRAFGLPGISSRSAEFVPCKWELPLGGPVLTAAGERRRIVSSVAKRRSVRGLVRAGRSHELVLPLRRSPVGTARRGSIVGAGGAG